MGIQGLSSLTVGNLSGRGLRKDLRLTTSAARFVISKIRQKHGKKLQEKSNKKNRTTKVGIVPQKTQKNNIVKPRQVKVQQLPKKLNVINTAKEKKIVNLPKESNKKKSLDLQKKNVKSLNQKTIESDLDQALKKLGIVAHSSIIIIKRCVSNPNELPSISVRDLDMNAQGKKLKRRVAYGIIAKLKKFENIAKKPVEKV